MAGAAVPSRRRWSPPPPGPCPGPASPETGRGASPDSPGRALLLLLPFACAPEPPVAVAVPSAAGLRVEATAPVQAVEVRDPAGVVARRTVDPPAERVEVAAALEPGAYTVRVRAASGEAEVPLVVRPTPPVRVEVQVRPGQPWVEAGERVTVPVLGDRPAEVLVAVVAGPGHPDSVRIADEVLPLRAPGERVVRAVRVEGPTLLQVGDRVLPLVPERVALDTVRLVAADAWFPAGPDGAPEPGRPAFRVTLPDPLWAQVARALGLGVRPVDPWAPWGHAGLRLRNDGDRPLGVVVRLRVAGDPPAFRPRLRDWDGDTGVVAALLELAPGREVDTALPVFVDRETVEPGAYTLRWEVVPLGGDTPVLVEERPLYVVRGDRAVAVGFAGAVLAALGGLGWTAARLRTWLERSATSELMTIALFGTAQLVVGVATDLVAMGLGAVLGPFATLVTGLITDVARTVLLVSLLTLLPRPGVLALSILTGWLGRGLLLGGFSPVDLLYVGASLGLGEGFAWLAGLTRGGEWREEAPVRRWGRLVVGLGGASVALALVGLALHAVLYRLYFAPWYVALQALGPGFAYVAAAAWLAVPFAASLRRVEA